jgi:hypothetical protein
MLLLGQLALGDLLRDVLCGLDAHAAGGHVVALAPRALALLSAKLEAVAPRLVVATAHGRLGLGLVVVVVVVVVVLLAPAALGSHRPKLRVSWRF